MNEEGKYDRIRIEMYAWQQNNGISEQLEYHSFLRFDGLNKQFLPYKLKHKTHTEITEKEGENKWKREIPYESIYFVYIRNEHHSVTYCMTMLHF